MNDAHERIRAAAVELARVIDEARQGIPRGGGYDEARALGRTCRDAEVMVRAAVKRMERKSYARPRFAPTPVDTVTQDIIDAGYRAMAAKMHPDVGGSNEEMARLNNARDKLRGR
jgi:hypothetical protein